MWCTLPPRYKIGTRTRLRNSSERCGAFLIHGHVRPCLRAAANWRRRRRSAVLRLPVGQLNVPERSGVLSYYTI